MKRFFGILRWIEYGLIVMAILIFGLSFIQNKVKTIFQPGNDTVIEDKGIKMLPSTVKIEEKIRYRVMDLLADEAAERGVFVYAVTNVDKKNNYYNVSVAGLPLDSVQMVLSDSIWLGVVQIGDTKELPGSVQDLMPSQPNEGNLQEFGVGGSTNILPFRDKTTATYGVNGVHSCGFQLNGWKAVDIFPSENMIYAANSGQVSYVCRDGTQVAMRIGDEFYDHLVDAGQQTGDKFQQGQALGGLVPGTFNTTCGYASQSPSAYHVHFCFLPDPNGKWNADGYALDVTTGNWVKGAATVSPTGTLTADWANANVSAPGPAVGSNFWDSLVAVTLPYTLQVKDNLPDHQYWGMPDKIPSIMAIPIKLLYFVILVNFNMTVVMWVFGIICALEAVRLIISLIGWIKKVAGGIGGIVGKLGL